MELFLAWSEYKLTLVYMSIETQFLIRGYLGSTNSKQDSQKTDVFQA